jgi:integrase/recombinase XerD
MGHVMNIARTAHEGELVRMWTVAGLQRQTIAIRLSIYRRVGEEHATRESIEQVLAGLRHPTTKAMYLSHLRLTYRALIERELIQRDPTIGIPSPRRPRRVPRPVSPVELDMLLTLAREPVRSWVILAAFAGLRASEIAGLRGDDLEQHDGGWTLRIRGKGGHVGLVPAHDQVYVVMSRHGPGPIWPLTPSWVSKKASAEFRRIGISGGIHRCRHSFATRALAAADGDLLVVRDLMRHASVQTTQIYTQLADERPRAVMDLIR